MAWRWLILCSFWRCFFIWAACCLSLILSGSVILCFALEIRNPEGARWFIRCLLDLQWLWSEWVCMVWYEDDRCAGTPPGAGRLDGGSWFPLGSQENALEGRGHLFEPQASCVTFSPPFAFFCKLRGTVPEIPSTRSRTQASTYPLANPPHISYWHSPPQFYIIDINNTNTTYERGLYSCGPTRTAVFLWNSTCHNTKSSTK